MIYRVHPVNTTIVMRQPGSQPNDLTDPVMAVFYDPVDAAAVTSMLNDDEQTVTPNRPQSQLVAALLETKWYPVVNDLIGGWAVATAPLPVSAHSPANGVVAVGDFLDREIAEHIAELHNRTLE